MLYASAEENLYYSAEEFPNIKRFDLFCFLKFLYRGRLKLRESNTIDDYAKDGGEEFLPRFIACVASANILL